MEAADVHVTLDLVQSQADPGAEEHPTHRPLAVHLGFREGQESQSFDLRSSAVGLAVAPFAEFGHDGTSCNGDRIL